MNTSLFAQNLSANQIKKLLSPILKHLPKSDPFTIHQTLLQASQNFLKNFTPLSFPAGFGFDNFTESQIQDYLLNSSTFELKLPKAKGKSILYGLDHVKVRQSLLNNLPLKIRLSILIPKFIHYQIFQKLSKFISFANPNPQLIQIKDIKDIGMGHSIYLVTFSYHKSINHQAVIKREAIYNQTFYTNLLQALNWPSFKTMHFSDSTGNWELTQYLGSLHMSEILTSNSLLNNSQIETQLASHSALGDIIGRGDRHLENYHYFQKNIYPIDISFLFWENNHHWIAKYISGGMYEINYLENYISNPKIFQQKLKNFFKTYQKTLKELKEKQSLILDIITSFFQSINQDTNTKYQYVASKLNNLSQFYQTQKNLYETNLKISLKRKSLKQNLEKKIQQNPELLQRSPYLKMYYFANKSRHANFFLLEDQPASFISLLNSIFPKNQSHKFFF